MLQIAANWIEQETAEIAAAKEAHLAETCPAPDLSGDQAALMVKTPQIKLRSESDGHEEPELMFLFTSTGHLQEAVPVPRQDRRGQIRLRGQSGEDRQRGTGML